MNILLIILYFIIGFIFLIFPIILTIINFLNLFLEHKIKENLIDTLIFILGIGFSIVLFISYDFLDYNESLRLGGIGEIDLHSPIASWSYPTIILIFIIGIVSYILIRKRKLNLPPIIIVGAMSGILICSLYMIIWIVQLSEHLFEMEYIMHGLPYLILFPINYILCAIRAEKTIMKIYKKENLNKKEYKKKFLNICNNLLYDIDNWPILSIVLMFPIIIILTCVLIIFGQRPDEAIRAFLETSDWALSTKISPPDITYDAHYLCTVSLRGHKEIVKPLRIGIRHGEKIIVNRQLCIANAFEDYIKEKLPKTHRFIRYIYDKYGYPLSKHINTKLQADITYILMKPLEWIFIIFLYTFDIKPENRIKTQYIGKKIKI